MGNGNAGWIAIVLVFILVMLSIAAITIGVIFAALLIYSIVRAYHFRNNYTPHHEILNPTEIPFVVQPGETVLLGHTKSTLVVERNVRNWRNSRSGVGLGYGYSRRGGLGGLIAWGSSGTGKSWTTSEPVRIKGQAYLTDKRLVFLRNLTVSETIPLSELASANANRSSVLIATENHGKIRKFQLRLSENGPAQRIIVSRWSRTMMESQEKLGREEPIRVASHTQPTRLA